MPGIVLASLLVMVGFGAELRRNPMVNAASQWAEIGPGTVVSVHGVGLGSRFELAMAGRAGVRLEVVRVMEKRVDVWVPPELGVGRGELGVGALRIPVVLRRGAGGLFSANGMGWGMAEKAGPYAPGEAVELAATGLAVGSRVPVVVGRSNVMGTVVRGAGRRVAVRFVLPADVVEGCSVPVMAGLSNVVAIAVRKGSGGCVYGGPLPVVRDGKNGIVVRTEEPEAGVTAVFFASDGRRMSPPAVGTCSTFVTAAGESVGAMLLRGYGGVGLDAGSLAVNDGSFRVEMPGGVGAVGMYRMGLEGRRGLHARAERLFVTGSGGKDFPAFGVGVKAPVRLEWRNVPAAVSRRKALEVAWSGGAREGWIGVLGVSRDGMEANATYCVASAMNDKFTVPAGFWGNLRGDTAEIYVIYGSNEILDGLHLMRVFVVKRSVGVTE
ncbi:MAG: hypothetical protein U0R19_14565 [Bryobacteraceae bacterium]